MIVGWSWEWPPPRCSPAVPHEWVRDWFAVSNYVPGEARTVCWWRCRECQRRTSMEPRP